MSFPGGKYGGDGWSGGVCSVGASIFPAKRVVTCVVTHHLV